MFFELQSDKQKKEYENFLKVVGSLSNLFSDSLTPYLYYRVAEKIFCRAFGAEDLSRGDVSADAKKLGVGIGLKTFLQSNNKSFQKVAEFNRDRYLYHDLDHELLVQEVSRLRNKRIEFTENTHKLKSSIYHCVVRDSGKFKIFEESMDKINIDKIKAIKSNKSSISFRDDKNEYSFLLSKSTLTKRFTTDTFLYDFDVDILGDPIYDLTKLLQSQNLIFNDKNEFEEKVFLPLYSSTKAKGKYVAESSSLNQWNARGRARNHNEVYIRIPKEVHDNYPTFFPNRETSFNLKLPNGEVMNSKVCSDNGKALMSYSNRELGKWILRDVLNVKEGELLTYKMLEDLEIDSVRIDKLDEQNYEINFTALGSYESFKETFKK